MGFVVHTNPAKVAEEVGQFWWSDSRIDASVLKFKHIEFFRANLTVSQQQV